jgi:hypothetical protein
METYFTNGDQCFTDGDWCLPNGSKDSSVANPQKVAKIDE